MTVSGTAQAELHPRETTTCAIAGCGPAGALLGLMLARAGIEVLVLEKHADFFRDFRGDTIHPSTLEILEELGLFEAFSQLPQQRLSTLEAVTDSGAVTVADFRDLKVRHPYIAFVPQWDFLDFLTEEARRCPSFTLRMDAEAVDLLRSGERVTGLRYRARDGLREVGAALTVAADGRDSALRRAAGLAPVRHGAPMDILWFRVSRRDSDREGTFGRFTAGRFMAMIDRGDYWQAAFAIPKGSLGELQARGIETLRESVAALIPFLAERVGELESWDDVSMLEVQVNRLRRWHLPGLLCIGDAAHAMSPIGGVGINLAIQDAVAAANLLTEPLLKGALSTRDLAGVRRRRWPATAVIQGLQRVIQRRVVRPVLSGTALRPPRALGYLARIGFLRRLPARLVGLGVRPEHVRMRLPARPARR